MFCRGKLGLFSDFFDRGSARRMVAARPLPFFVQANAAICQQLGAGAANPCHQLALRIDMLVAHIQIAIGIADSD